jgi:hypothetical protein
MTKWKMRGLNLLAMALFIAAIVLLYWVVTVIWEQFKTLDKQVAIGLLTAATTIFVSTITVVLGRYLERKKEIESHFRAQKIEIYDAFLKEFFKLFSDTGTAKEREDMAPFLREWQRKMIVWGGQDVLKSYIDWMERLKAGEPDAKAMWMAEDFFRAVRKDLGHPSKKLPRGAFLRMILRNAELFIQMSKNDPQMTLSQFAELEKKWPKQ